MASSPVRHAEPPCATRPAPRGATLLSRCARSPTGPRRHRCGRRTALRTMRPSPQQATLRALALGAPRRTRPALAPAAQLPPPVSFSSRRSRAFSARSCASSPVTIAVASPLPSLSLTLTTVKSSQFRTERPLRPRASDTSGCPSSQAAAAMAALASGDVDPGPGNLCLCRRRRACGLMAQILGCSGRWRGEGICTFVHEHSERASTGWCCNHKCAIVQMVYVQGRDS
jgi:hypothetical protein